MTATNPEPKYTTVLDFNKFLSAEIRIPNRKQSTYPAREVVGTAYVAGITGNSAFYFDAGNVIRNSETIYVGPTNNNAVTAFVRGTDYIFDDYDDGRFSFTGTGTAKINSGDQIFAEYFYNKYDQRDSNIYNVLVENEAFIDSTTNTVFFDGDAATPDFVEVTEESKEGQGFYNKVYALDKYPVNDTTTELTGAIGAGSSIIPVTSTNGFPSSGYVGVEDDKIEYASKLTTAFIGATAVASTHASGSTVTSFIIERSLESAGASPSWVVMSYLSDYDMDFLAGEVKLNDDSYEGISTFDNFTPPIGVWNRVRATYQYGYNEITKDIKKLIHLLAAKELFSGQVLNALSRGTDGFSTEGISDIKIEIDKLIKKYKAWMVKDIKP